MLTGASVTPRRSMLVTAEQSITGLTAGRSARPDGVIGTRRGEPPAEAVLAHTGSASTAASAAARRTSDQLINSPQVGTGGAQSTRLSSRVRPFLLTI